MGKQRIVASVDPRNTASLQLIKRLGFREEGYFKQRYDSSGEWADDIMFAMLKAE